MKLGQIWPSDDFPGKFIFIVFILFNIYFSGDIQNEIFEKLMLSVRMTLCEITLDLT